MCSCFFIIDVQNAKKVGSAEAPGFWYEHCSAFATVTQRKANNSKFIQPGQCAAPSHTSQDNSDRAPYHSIQPMIFPHAKYDHKARSILATIDDKDLIYLPQGSL